MSTYCVEHRPDALPGYRIPEPRIQLSQRLQHKPPLTITGMRNLQLRRLHNRIPVEHNVDIDCAWPVHHRASAPKSFLGSLRSLQQLNRKQLRLKLRCLIQKPRCSRSPIGSVS